MEYSAFEKVPQKHRTYSFWDQAALWFGACSLPAAWTYGALMAGWQGIAGAALLIFGVNTISLIPWAYLGEMAAATGGSSMAIVRPAFGIRGSVIPSVFYLIFGFGWGIVNVFLGAIALSFIFKLWLGWPSYIDPGNLWYMIGYIAVVCISQGYFAVAGNQMIKKLQWVATVFFLLLGVYQTYVVFQHWGVAAIMAWKPQHLLTTMVGPFSYPLTFAILADLLIAYNWTWEFIGDFSRFATTKKSGTWGPFLGACLAQFWWFMVGAFAVIYLALTTGQYSPLLADPSSTTVALGLGWLAALIILFATITTNAGNIYASALGISNILGAWKKKNSLPWLLVLSSFILLPLSLLPLLSQDFVGFFIFLLDFMGAIVIPLWTITVVDYFWVRNRKISDDIYKTNGGAYWYKNGWNWPGISILLAGTLLYWVIAYRFVFLRETISASVPTIAFVAVTYVWWMKKKYS